ncbi:MAG TPA: universal stress protein [Burkholderiales bacterium]|nr:universal stress protein [Burkholderiales bacterium]
MFKRILIPTDGSTLSRRGAKAGIRFAKAVGAKITAYHGLETNLPYLAGEGALIDAALIETLEKAARQRGARYVAEVAKAARAAGITCQTYVTKPVTPYQGIIDAARRKRCDAIFMASHGRGGVASLILGSVAQSVLSHSRIPVVVYR